MCSSPGFVRHQSTKTSSYNMAVKSLSFPQISHTHSATITATYSYVFCHSLNPALKGPVSQRHMFPSGCSGRQSRLRKSDCSPGPLLDATLRLSLSLNHEGVSENVALSHTGSHLFHFTTAGWQRRIAFGFLILQWLCRKDNHMNMTTNKAHCIWLFHWN